MTGIVHVSIGDVGDALVVLDATRRVYVAASSDGSYLHVVSPSQVDVAHPDTGEILRRAGDLTCVCRGGVYHGRCYRIDQALAFEAGDARVAALPDWMHDAAPGELMEAFGK